jgi:hypothetical protein
VPDHRIQRFIDMVEGGFGTSHKGDEQNANMAFIPVAALILVGAQIGLARHAMERTLANLPKKNVAYTCYTNARNSPTHQVGVAVAATVFDRAEMLMQRAAPTSIGPLPRASSWTSSSAPGAGWTPASSASWSPTVCAR